MSFNPLPSCEGRRFFFVTDISYLLASIHFPLAREDEGEALELASNGMLQSTSLLRGKTDIPAVMYNSPRASIHFPLAREDTSLTFVITESAASIHFPLAREDNVSLANTSITSSFNPLPSCEGRQIAKQLADLQKTLQSTSLLRGKTCCRHPFVQNRMLQSTSLLRGKTKLWQQL